MQQDIKDQKAILIWVYYLFAFARIPCSLSEQSGDPACGAAGSFIEDVDGFTRINLETEISNLLNRDVDLIDMKKSSPVLRHQIYKHGRLIYYDGSDFPFQFRAGSIRDYLDTDCLRRLSPSIHKFDDELIDSGLSAE